MTPTPIAWQSETVHVAGTALHLTRGGSGAPLLVLHHDIGSPEQLPFYDALAQHFTVLRAVASGLRPLRAAGLDAQRAGRGGRLPVAARRPRSRGRRPSLLGLGFGGWIAAEMATMAPRAFRRLVLVGAMGIKPERGRDRSTRRWSPTSTTCDRASSTRPRSIGSSAPSPRPPPLEQWDLNREMTFRIAWKPYMYSADAAAPARRRRHAGPGRVGARRPDRAAGVRRALREVARPRRAWRSSRAPATSSRWSSPEALASLVTRFVTQA